jgi:hypothetical protein
LVRFRGNEAGRGVGGPLGGVGEVLRGAVGILGDEEELLGGAFAVEFERGGDKADGYRVSSEGSSGEKKGQEEFHGVGATIMRGIGFSSKGVASWPLRTGRTVSFG